MSEKEKVVVNADPTSVAEGKVYIHIHKSFCKQMESKTYNGIYNIMHIPPNVKVGALDLSGAILNPKTMFEDQKNPNMMCGVYNKAYLQDNAVKVAFYKGGTQGYEYKMVDVDELSNAIKMANHNYLQHKDHVALQDKHEHSLSKTEVKAVEGEV